jgi:hypothetical protein
MATIYKYDVPISLVNPAVYNIVESGQTYVFNLRDADNFMRKVRVFREIGDEPDTMRLYKDFGSSSVQVMADNDWVQVPEQTTDARIEGDLRTGTITFREHIAAEPVMP